MEVKLLNIHKEAETVEVHKPGPGFAPETCNEPTGGSTDSRSESLITPAGLTQAFLPKSRGVALLPPGSGSLSASLPLEV